MDSKYWIIIFICLTIAIKVQSIPQLEHRLLRQTNDEMVKLFGRQIRSFGCNGIHDRNEYRCRLHCRSMGYKTGYCTSITQYEDCVCSKSPFPRSKNSNFFPVVLNISRL